MYNYNSFAPLTSIEQVKVVAADLLTLGATPSLILDDVVKSVRSLLVSTPRSSWAIKYDVTAEQESAYRAALISTDTTFSGFIKAIKMFRDDTHMGLKESKEAIEELRGY